MYNELVSNIISAVSAIAGVFATVFAAFELRNSRKANAERTKRERKESTVSAYNILQNQVLDRLVVIRPDEVVTTIENLDDIRLRDAYNDYKALIARCEHFAVGINEGVYDFDVLYKLSGEHLIYLYKKVEPIINHARENCANSIPFCEFETMVTRLDERIKSEREG